jgi:GGDEF domain-containing protein
VTDSPTGPTLSEATPGPRPHRVVIFDPCTGSGSPWRDALSDQEIVVINSRNTTGLVAELNRARPGLVVVVVDSLGALTMAFDARAYLERETIPAMIVAPARVATAAAAAGWTFDRYLDVTEDPAVFTATVTTLLRRTRYLLELSVDTGLPGTTWMREHLQSDIDAARDFSLILFDIDRFKSVVDTYGFARAGDFLTAMAASLRAGAEACGAPQAKIAHIGGDDFLALCAPEQVLPLTRRVVTAFEAAADAIYDPIDVRRGYLEIPSRWGTGPSLRAALVTLSNGVAESTSGHRLRSPGEAMKIASEMKSVAKTQPGSYVAIDRRPRHGDRAA